MIVHGYLAAFHQGDGEAQLRRIEIPEELGSSDIEKTLDLAFQYGQNDFQPQEMPSISVGDVLVIPIGILGIRYRVMGLGFRQMGDDEPILAPTEEDRRDLMCFGRFGRYR